MLQDLLNRRSGADQATCQEEQEQQDLEDDQSKYGRRHGKKYVNLSPFVGAALVVLLLPLLYLAVVVATKSDQPTSSSSRRALYERAGALVQGLRHNLRYTNRHDNDEHYSRPRGVGDGGNPAQSLWARNGVARLPSLPEIQAQFAQQRLALQSRQIPTLLQQWKARWDQHIVDNVHQGIQWVPAHVLPGMDDLPRQHRQRDALTKHEAFDAVREGLPMQWVDEWEALVREYGGVDKVPGPLVDYTDKSKYEYPPVVYDPPGGYPHLQPLGEIMNEWDQDEDKQGMITETLLHFDFQNPKELQAAKRFRDAILPFKLVNVPEMDRATALWTDEYVANEFDNTDDGPGLGRCQESTNHMFCFYIPQMWDPLTLGMPPVRNNDYSFAMFAQHARYADATKLATDQPHFYWQSGVGRQERYQPKSEWSFISRDIPSFSATDENFIMFHPEEQKGIQCRFGERGVVAATHYDSGRNMIGMITGAKRYILSPPNACGTLGLFADRHSPLFRHSILNFGHLKYLDDPQLGKDMPEEEREWLQRAATTPTVETVLKAGEILYLPSFWFHYIVSLQKSAQCNVRSGIQKDQHPEFGGYADVEECRVE